MAIIGDDQEPAVKEPAAWGPKPVLAIPSPVPLSSSESGFSYQYSPKPSQERSATPTGSAQGSFVTLQPQTSQPAFFQVPQTQGWSSPSSSWGQPPASFGGSTDQLGTTASAPQLAGNTLPPAYEDEDDFGIATNKPAKTKGNDNAAATKKVANTAPTTPIKEAPKEDEGKEGDEGKGKAIGKDEASPGLVSRIFGGWLGPKRPSSMHLPEEKTLKWDPQTKKWIDPNVISPLLSLFFFLSSVFGV